MSAFACIILINTSFKRRTDWRDGRRCWKPWEGGWVSVSDSLNRTIESVSTTKSVCVCVIINHVGSATLRGWDCHINVMNGWMNEWRNGINEGCFYEMVHEYMHLCVMYVCMYVCMYLYCRRRTKRRTRVGIEWDAWYNIDYVRRWPKEEWPTHWLTVTH